MSINKKIALAVALVLATSSAVLAAPRHALAPSQAEQNWLDRASDPNTSVGG